MIIPLKYLQDRPALYEANLKNNDTGDVIWIIVGGRHFYPKKAYRTDLPVDSLIPVEIGDHVAVATFKDGHVKNELQIRLAKITEIGHQFCEVKVIGDAWDFPVGAATMLETLKDKVYDGLTNCYVKRLK